MRKYVYAALMLAYIGFSIVVINYASKSMQNEDFTVIASKAKDMAILTAKIFKITDAEVEELKKLEFGELHQHPANIRLTNMFDRTFGYDNIRFVYVMVALDDDEVKYQVTEEYEEFFETEAGTPLNVLWLVDVVVDRTMDEILEEDGTYYNDIKRYSYLRPHNVAAFEDKVPFYELADDEYGAVISGMAPFYTEEGTFVGMLGIDIDIDEYERSVGLIKLLLFIVFLLPSVALTAIYILLYVMNLKEAYVAAQTDPLTSVGNRRFLDKYLSKIVKEHYKKHLPLSVIMIDIDHFKLYNDHYGHPQGDRVLMDITRAINSVLRGKKDILCRYGGEEFLVILSNTKNTNAETVANRMKITVNNLAIKHEYSPVTGIITISQGIYSAVPSNTDTDKIFVEYADQALYKAKDAGRNQYVSFTGTT